MDNNFKIFKNKIDKDILSFMKNIECDDYKENTSGKGFNENILNNIKAFNITDYNKNYSSKIVSAINHSGEQKIFNYLTNGAIKKTIKLLTKKTYNKDIINLYKYISIKIPNLLNFINLSPLKSYFYKLEYIFFYYILYIRKIIAFLQLSKLNINEYIKYCTKYKNINLNKYFKLKLIDPSSIKWFSFHFLKYRINSLYGITKHEASNKTLKRLRNYKNINKNIEYLESLKILNSKIIIETNNVDKKNKLECKNIKIYLNINNTLFNTNSIKSYLKIKYYKENNKVVFYSKKKIYLCMEKDKNIGNFLSNNINKNDTIKLYEILAKCLYLLDNEIELDKLNRIPALQIPFKSRKLAEDKSNDISQIKTIIEKKKYIIILFYYVFIFNMPFYRGTAFVAEVALYSLWAKYIDNSNGNNYTRHLFIKDNIMLDVEALSLPFNKFYENCFNNSKTEYTPYLEII